jgi:integrase
MPRLQINQAPSYRLHRQSGQAIVTFNGRDVLLGAHGSPESRQ